MRKNIYFLAIALLISPALNTSALAAVVYNNGPISTSINAWHINSGIAVSNSFTLATGATLTGVDFGVWTLAGDTPVSVQWGISTSPDYTNSAGGGGTPAALLTNSLVCSGCASTDDAYTSSFSLPNIALAAGTYWLSFQNAVTAQNDGMFWDINNGPSQAYVNSLGNVQNILSTGSNSNSFQILGTQDPVVIQSATPEPATMTLLLPILLLCGGALMRRKIRG